MVIVCIVIYNGITIINNNYVLILIHTISVKLRGMLVRILFSFLLVQWCNPWATRTGIFITLKLYTPPIEDYAIFFCFMFK